MKTQNNAYNEHSKILSEQRRSTLRESSESGPIFALLFKKYFTIVLLQHFPIKTFFKEENNSYT